VGKRTNAAHAAKGAAAPESADRAAPGRLKGLDGDASAPLDLDRVIHERLRLAIVSALAVHDVLTFNELKAMLDASDGNLSVHARKLEDAGYVACKKGYDGRIPRTEFRLTAAGRKALERYLGHMEALIKRIDGGR